MLSLLSSRGAYFTWWSASTKRMTRFSNGETVRKGPFLFSRWIFHDSINIYTRTHRLDIYFFKKKKKDKFVEMCRKVTSSLLCGRLCSWWSPEEEKNFVIFLLLFTSFFFLLFSSALNKWKGAERALCSININLV
jgi:hypothetical protein